VAKHVCSGRQKAAGAFVHSPGQRNSYREPDFRVAKDAADIQPGDCGWQAAELQEKLGVTASFKDHFSAQSDGYARYRPTYPAELLQFLASLTDRKTLAWDCATGSGQVAVALTDYFSNVVASDASESQIAAAIQHGGIEYRVAAAEQSGLSDNSVDLITVAQAFHWFDQDAFITEVRRVLRPQGVLAIWCYELCTVNESCDAIVDTLYRDIVGEFWPPEREMIEQGYAGIALPGVSVPVPQFTMVAAWHVADMLGYLRTWSACKRYESQQGTDPVADISAALSDAWGDGERRVSWPLAVKVSRPNTLLE
jgi:SAM-dependent methyltransferase